MTINKKTVIVCYRTAGQWGFVSTGQSLLYTCARVPESISDPSVILLAVERIAWSELPVAS
jgi:hypothetical protein